LPTKTGNAVLEGFEEDFDSLFWKRVITTVIGIPIVLLLIYEGKFLFLLSVICLAVFGLKELNQIFLQMNYHLPRLLFSSGILYPLLAYFFPCEQDGSFLFAGLICLLLLHMAVMMFCFPRFKIGEIAVSFLGGCYFSLLITHLILIRNIAGNGFYYLLLVFILTWSCDIGAYCTGQLLGQHALCPTVSPGKTVEGAVGGVLFCFLAAIVFQLIYPHLFSYPIIIMLGIITGIVAQIGDLVESSLKRLGKIKDSGELFPGHGGILDRFDSLLFSAPTAYYFIKLLSM